ncbi:hypothetical protein BC827DRAFT_969513 [Russula dissimulans]|nr:hypothetical protein BC827DRAFT_969513 [Russula dissimulans]
MPKPHQVKKTEPFDEFFKKVNKGRAYRCQALELIKICRIFSAGPEQPFHGEHFLRDAKLQEVLKECDLTIARAIDSRCKLREDTGLPFERATRKLLEYASKFHLSLKDINKDMKTAKDRDQKRKDQDKMRMNKPILSQHTEPEESLKTVEFHILESLPYKDPVIVHREP